MTNHKRQHCEMDGDNNSATDGTVEDGNELLKELKWKLAASEVNQSHSLCKYSLYN
jgi:hypothetical protein